MFGTTELKNGLGWLNGRRYDLGDKNMNGRVHQEDETKLKATVALKAASEIEVVQPTAADLNATVTQLAKDRTVTGAVTANAGTNLNTSALATSAKQLADGHNVTVDNASIPVTGTFYPETQPVSGTFYPETQPVSGTVTAEQATAANLKCTASLAAGTNNVGSVIISTIPDVELDPFDTLLSSSVTLTTANTAYLLPASAQSGRRMLVVYNNTGHDLFIGHSGVSTSNGLTVADEKHIVIGASGGVYAVCATASVTVRILELK